MLLIIKFIFISHNIWRIQRGLFRSNLKGIKYMSWYSSELPLQWASDEHHNICFYQQNILVGKSEKYQYVFLFKTLYRATAKKYTFYKGVITKFANKEVGNSNLSRYVQLQ